MSASKGFRKEKDLRLFVKKFLKDALKGIPAEKPIEVEVISLNPPQVKLIFPFYSEGNLLRAYEVDFLLHELYNKGISVNLFYEDDLSEVQSFESPCACPKRN